MSTPTAAGETAPRMPMTDPTVAPFPKCTSGMTATWATQGRLAMLRSWVRACDSTWSTGVQSRTSTVSPRSRARLMTRLLTAGPGRCRPPVAPVHPGLRQSHGRSSAERVRDLGDGVHPGHELAQRRRRSVSPHLDRVADAARDRGNACELAARADRDPGEPDPERPGLAEQIVRDTSGDREVQQLAPVEAQVLTAAIRRAVDDHRVATRPAERGGGPRETVRPDLEVHGLLSPWSGAGQHGSNRRRLIMTPGHGECALRTGDLGTRRLPPRRRAVGRVRTGDRLGSGVRRSLAGMQRAGAAPGTGARDPHRVQPPRVERPGHLRGGWLGGLG